jgi:hypothetical protein
MRALVQFARPYDFVDSSSGRRVSGVTLWVTDLDAVAGEEDAVIGFEPVKMSGSLDIWTSLKTNGPGKYDLGLTVRMGKNERGQSAAMGYVSTATPIAPADTSRRNGRKDFQQSGTTEEAGAPLEVGAPGA